MAMYNNTLYYLITQDANFATITVALDGLEHSNPCNTIPQGFGIAVLFGFPAHKKVIFKSETPLAVQRFSGLRDLWKLQERSQRILVA